CASAEFFASAGAPAEPAGITTSCRLPLVPSMMVTVWVPGAGPAGCFSPSWRNAVPPGAEAACGPLVVGGLAGASTASAIGSPPSGSSAMAVQIRNPASKKDSAAATALGTKASQPLGLGVLPG